MELDSIVVGDCLDVMGEMPSNYVSTVITDPPYGLSGEPDMVEVLTHWLAGDDYEQRGGGFMGKSWDSFVPGPSVWREVYRVMKPGGTLLAFGGTRTNDLLSIAIRLAGFRKFDEIDYYYGGLPPQMAWVTGQGFPKSLALDRAIDRHLGKDRERVWFEVPRNGGGDSSDHVNQLKGRKPGVKMDSAPATEAAALWSGYGTGLKPAHEVILCFYKPREGSYAHNALHWGVAGLWIDSGRIGITQYDIEEYIPNRCGWKDGINYRQPGDNGIETPTDFAHGMNKPHQVIKPQGRWPANLLLSHVPDRLCPDCDGDGLVPAESLQESWEDWYAKTKDYGGSREEWERLCQPGGWSQCPTCSGSGELPGCYRRGTRRVQGDKRDGSITDTPARSWKNQSIAGIARRGYADPDGYEQVDDWDCVEGCPVAALAAQSGNGRSGGYPPAGKVRSQVSTYGKPNERGEPAFGPSKGTAARFFYQAKASRNERNLGCQDVYWRKDKSASIGFVRIDRKEWDALPEKQRARGNIHPTVKPLGVVEYLCRLTRTPTGGVVFDPFCGTGTTALGAFKTGRRWLCCDNQADYVYLANLRIEALKAETPQMELSL